MLNDPVLIINKPQVKTSSWSKNGHNAHFWPPHIKIDVKPVYVA